VVTGLNLYCIFLENFDGGAELVCNKCYKKYNVNFSKIASNNQFEILVLNLLVDLKNQFLSTSARTRI